MVDAETPFTPEDDCYHQLSDDPYATADAVSPARA